mmetsp:Transcript_39485/g.43680  ORF Transcript_39485/g.43680 Transcript_39485/m.43680 type:complete len:803 (+) Transcript_39485:115-2523(+)
MEQSNEKQRRILPSSLENNISKKQDNKRLMSLPGGGDSGRMPPPPSTRIGNDNDANSAADGARARRRIELERLKRTTRGNINIASAPTSGNSVSSRTEDLLAKARDQLYVPSANSSTSSLTSAGHHPPVITRIPRPPPPPMGPIRTNSVNSVSSDISNSIDNRQFLWQQQQRQQQQRQQRVYNHTKGGTLQQPQQQPSSQTKTSIGGYPHQRAPALHNLVSSQLDKKSTSTADAGAGVPPPPRKEELPKKPLLPASSSTAMPRRPSPIIPLLGEKITTTQQQQQEQQNRNNRRQHYSAYDTVSSPHEADLLNELKRVHQDKEDAFRQVVRLREQVQKLSAPPTIVESAEEEFIRLVEKADREGERAALQWARQQVERSCSRKKNRQPMFGFPSPARSRSSTKSPSRRALNPAIGPGLRKRTTTPHPRTRDGGYYSPELLALATRSNPDEYDSQVATYKIRRPYAPHEEDTFWKDVGELSLEEYQSTASVQIPSSLEVAAVIKADNSVLLVFHASDCRHKKKKAKVWRSFDNIDERDQPLGSVMFIDIQANEGEYWLDEIFEEAMSTRDTYCSSLLSTAAALESNLAQQAAPHNNVASQQQDKGTTMPPPMVQINQQTENGMAQSKPTATMQHPVIATNGELRQPPLVIMPSTAGSISSSIPTAIQQSPQWQLPSSPPPLVPEQPQQHPTLLLNGNKTEDAVTENKEKSSNGIIMSKEKEESPIKDSPPPEEEVNDLLSAMLGSLIYATVVMLYFLSVKLPFAMFKLGIYATIVSFICWITWLRCTEYDPPGVLLGTNQVGIE